MLPNYVSSDFLTKQFRIAGESFQTSRIAPVLAVQNFSSMASHAWGSLYAMEDGVLTEYTIDPNDSTTTWNKKGPVTTS